MTPPKATNHSQSPRYHMTTPTKTNTILKSDQKSLRNGTNMKSNVKSFVDSDYWSNRDQQMTNFDREIDWNLSLEMKRLQKYEPKNLKA